MIATALLTLSLLVPTSTFGLGATQLPAFNTAVSVALPDRPPTSSTPAIPAASTSIPTALSAASRPDHDADRRGLALARPSRSGRATLSVVLRAAEVPQSIRSFASCVLDRESGGTLDRIQSGAGARYPDASVSSASGRWQMLDGSGWREGGSWLVYKRLVASGLSKAEARRAQRFLAARPIYKWDGYFQDMAFIQSVSEGGWRHWANGDHCDSLAPRG